MARPARPTDIAAYSIFDTVGDIVGLVQALGESKAMVVGHDWGAPVAWHAALFRPGYLHGGRRLERAAAVPRPRQAARPLRQGGITNFYWQYFQTPGVAEAEFERDVARTMRIVLGGRALPIPAPHVRPGWQGISRPRRPEEPLPNWLSEADLAYFTEASASPASAAG